MHTKKMEKIVKDRTTAAKLEQPKKAAG